MFIGILELESFFILVVTCVIDIITHYKL